MDKALYILNSSIQISIIYKAAQIRMMFVAGAAVFKWKLKKRNKNGRSVLSLRRISSDLTTKTRLELKTARVRINLSSAVLLRGAALTLRIKMSLLGTVRLFTFHWTTVRVVCRLSVDTDNWHGHWHSSKALRFVFLPLSVTDCCECSVTAGGSLAYAG